MNFIEIKYSSLKKYNTLKLEAKADLIVFPLNALGVKEVYLKYGKEKEIIVIGKGSNILLSKIYYDKKYVFLNLKLMDSVEFVGSKIFIEAGATLSSLSWYALENNVQGYEFLEDVPGTLGGAVVMNAGTYENNIGQLIDSITYYNIEQEEVVSENVSVRDFGRRNSRYSDPNIIIISCLLFTKPGDYIESLNKLLEIKRNRYLKQPRNYPNAGSVFKRPILNGKDYFVWKLFNDLELRGLKRRDAMISDKHPGFIVNTGSATYEDIKYLIDVATDKVKKEFGIDLELEWKII